MVILSNLELIRRVPLFAMLTDALRPKDGWLAIPSGPGLAVEVDREVIERFAVR